MAVGAGRALHGPWTPPAAEAGAVVAGTADFTPSSPVGGSRGLAGCVAFPAPPPTPEGACPEGEVGELMGLIPIPIAPGVAVTPAGTKTPGPKPNLWLHLGKTPKIPVFNHFHSPTPRHHSDCQHSPALPAHRINAVTHPGEGNRPETCPGSHHPWFWVTPLCTF